MHSTQCLGHRTLVYRRQHGIAESSQHGDHKTMFVGNQNVCICGGSQGICACGVTASMESQGFCLLGVTGHLCWGHRASVTVGVTGHLYLGDHRASVPVWGYWVSMSEGVTGCLYLCGVTEHLCLCRVTGYMCLRGVKGVCLWQSREFTLWWV